MPEKLARAAQLLYKPVHFLRILLWIPLIWEWSIFIPELRRGCVVKMTVCISFVGNRRYNKVAFLFIRQFDAFAFVALPEFPLDLNLSWKHLELSH